MNLKTAIILLVLSIVHFSSIAQENTNRKLIEVILTDDENQGFYRPGVELPSILFKAASQDSLDLYIFDDLNQNPRPATFKEFQKLIEIPIDLYEEWNESVMYYLFDMVSYNGVNYICEEDNNKGNVPGNDLEFWKPEEALKYDYAEITKIVIDILEADSQKEITYLHFYLLNTFEEFEVNPGEYLVSVKAEDAIRVLNNSQIVWYEDVKGGQSFNHLVGDVFLNKTGGRTIEGLRLALNTINKVGLLRNYFNEELLQYQVALRYNYSESKVSNFYTCFGEELLETGETFKYNSDIFKTVNVNDYLELGDALISGKLKGKPLDLNYEVLSGGFSNSNSINTEINKLETKLLEQIDLRYYTNQDSRFDFELVISEVIKSIMNGDLPMYFYTLNNLYDINDGKIDKVDAFVIENLDPENGLPFDIDRSYNYADMVTVEKKKYYSLISDNLGNDPEFSPMSWGPTNPNRYSQSDVKIVEILYKQVFDNEGKILLKVPEYVMLTVPSSLTEEGKDRSMGAIKYKDLISLQKPDTEHWKKFIHELENQDQMIYRMLDYAPLKME